MRVLISGAAGSGTSTFAAALAARWSMSAIEADDLYWLPTVPPYVQKRDMQERNAQFAQLLQVHPNCVVASSVMNCGADAMFDLVVFLYVDARTRLHRLRVRETARHGAVNEEFIAWAAQYDQGTRNYERTCGIDRSNVSYSTTTPPHRRVLMR